MPKMHMVAASILLGGDENNKQVVRRGPSRPVSWPELLVLQTIHGEHSVSDVTVVCEVETSAAAEKERLRLIYGGVVNEVFPGRVPTMELLDPTHKAEGKGKAAKSKAAKTEAQTGGDGAADDAETDPLLAMDESAE